MREEEEEEELPAIGAGPVPAVSRVRVPTPRVSTAQIGMQLPGWQFHACPGRRASAATASLETYAPGKPGYLGDRPDLGLDPKPSGRIEAPAHHIASRPTSATRHPQTTACLSCHGLLTRNGNTESKTSRHGTEKGGS